MYGGDREGRPVKTEKRYDVGKFIVNHPGQ